MKEKYNHEKTFKVNPKTQEMLNHPYKRIKGMTYKNCSVCSRRIHAKIRKDKNYVCRPEWHKE